MRLTGVSQHFCVLPLLLLLLCQNGLCVSETNPMLEVQNRLMTGKWGGKHVILEVTENGAQLQFDCARGSIERPVTLDGEGRFNLQGTYARAAFGPQREDDPSHNQPARYSGAVKDQSMTLTVTLTRTNEEIGTFTLTHGRPGRIWRCH